MKLYLSSIGIPNSEELAKLIGKPLIETSVVIISNAQDYYSERVRSYNNNAFAAAFVSIGLKVTTLDLRDYSEDEVLKKELGKNDLVWARGGNTFCLRYEMRRSGFERIIKSLLEEGVVYGGDSAGALVAGEWIGGIESADNPDYAEEAINEGLSLVPFMVLPHVDNPEFQEVAIKVRNLDQAKDRLIELKDSQAVVFHDDEYRLV